MVSKTATLRNPGERFSQHLDAQEIGRVVEGGQRDEFLNGRDHLRRDQGRHLKPFTAVHDAMTNPIKVGFPARIRLRLLTRPMRSKPAA